MKTPAEIESQRNSLERQLAALDDAEQAWDDLSREHRITELFHRENCTLSHNSWEDRACRFEQFDWAEPSFVKNDFLSKVQTLLEVLPEDTADEKVLEIFKAARG